MNFLCYDGRTGRQLRELDGSGLVRGELTVSGADERTLIVSDEEGRACQRRFIGIIRQLLDEDGAVRLVAEPERHHILILTAQQHGLRRRVDGIKRTGFGFFHDIGARFQTGEDDGAVFRSGVSADDGTARTGSAAEVADLELRAL